MGQLKVKIDGVWWLFNLKTLELTLESDPSVVKKPWRRKSTGVLMYTLDYKNKKSYLANKIIYLAYMNPKDSIYEEHEDEVAIHIDGNKNNFEFLNLKLVSKKESYKYFNRNTDSKVKVKLKVIPDGKTFNSVSEAAEWMTTIGNGTKKTYSQDISKILNGKSGSDGYARKTILGRTFIKVNNE